MTTRRRKPRGGASNSPSVEPPEIDPVLPLPAHTDIPVMHQGDGEVILNDTRMMVVELPYRSFYLLWEFAERRAAKIYPQYSNRTDGMEKAAEAVAEAVHAFRSAFRGEMLPMMTKEQARDARIERAQWVEAQQAKKRQGKPSAAKAVIEDSISETSEEPEKKTRCREVFDGEPGGRCLGPDNGHTKHRDRHGNRWST